ncbi:MAG: SurA N-terminal domain-containing protein, partial [Pseudomonadota bacterium]
TAMREASRTGASSWIVKLLIIVPLVLAFAIWGIEDMIRGYSQSAVATVGDHEIQQEEFQENYNTQLSALSRQFGRRLTPQQAQAVGVPAQVLDRMINSQIIEQEARSLSLALSDDTVVREIQRDPLFQDSNGNFNQSALQGMIFRAGMSEQRFLEERRKDTLRNQLTASLLSSVHVPPAMLDIVNRYENEERKVRFITLPRTELDKIAAPDDEKLKAFYEKRKEQFRAPEFRKVALLEITSEAVQKAMTISDEDLRTAYEAQKDSYNTPEQRRVQQIVFPSKEKAEAALKSLREGKDFVEVAKENGVTEADINLGMQTQSQMIDTKVADAAFKLEKDQVSDVVEGLSIAVVRVTEIVPGDTKTFEDVKDQVRTLLASQRVGEAIQQLHDQVDELKLAGKSPAEIAKDLKVQFREIAAVDAQGQDPNGDTVISGADGAAILTSAFDGVVGVESEVVERRDGGYAWVDVLEITAARQKSFDDVKSDVLQAYRSREANDDVRKRSQAIVDRLGKGETLDALAKEAGLTVTESPLFKRADSAQGLTRTVVSQAFTLPENGASAAPAANATDRIVFQVSAIEPAKPLDGETRTQRLAQLKQSRQADVLGEYIAKLRTTYDVEINQPAITRALGLDQQ